MALELGPGDAVVTTPYSFFATAGCVARLGATPLFVDIDRATYNLSPARLREFFETQCELRGTRTVHKASGKAIRAIVPVHLFGLCCEMEPIIALAEKSRYPSLKMRRRRWGRSIHLDRSVRQAGTMGEFGTFSFYPSKNLGAAGDAGLVTCRTEHQEKRCGRCGSTGWSRAITTT